MRATSLLVDVQCAMMDIMRKMLSWCAGFLFILMQYDLKQAPENNDYFEVSTQDAGLLLRPPNPLVALRRGGAQLRDGQRAVPWQ